MSESLTISLTTLKLQCTSKKGISRSKGKEQYPASPTLLKALGFKQNSIQPYLDKRKEALDKKNIALPLDDRLRPYQLQDVHFLSLLPAKGIFNEQRTGKTPTALVTMRTRNETNNLLIVPKSTIYQWMKEYKTWHSNEVGTPLSWWTKQQRIEFYKTFKGSIIMSYGIAKNDWEALIKYRPEFDAILADEAHRLRNYRGMRSTKSTLQSKAVMKLRKHSKGAYALSGTPAPNYAYNVFGILAFLYPDLFKSYWSYIEFFFGVEKQDLFTRNMTITKENPVFLTDELKQIHSEFLEIISVQRKRRDVMKWLPKTDIKTITLPMLPNQRDMYYNIEQYYEHEDIVCTGILDQMIRLRQLTSCPSTLDHKVEGAKQKWLQDYRKDNPDKPIIIASMFTKSLEDTANELGLQKESILRGSMDGKRRAQIMEEFQTGKRKTILAQIDVIKEGVKLSRGEAIVVLDQSMTYTDNLQLHDRIVPTNQEDAIKKPSSEIIVLHLEKTIDKLIEWMLDKKMTSTEIVNDYLKHTTAPRIRGQ